MKRVISYILMCVILMSACGVVSARDICDADYCLYTFEDGLPDGVRYENASGSIGRGAYGNGRVLDGTEQSVVSLPFRGESGVKYRASLWVKSEEAVTIYLADVPLAVETATKGETGWMH